MKNKILAIALILTTILGIGTLTYARLVEDAVGNGPSTPEHTHSFSGATCYQAAKCSCGETSGSALGHSFGSFYNVGNIGHTHDCSRCGFSETFDHNNATKVSIGDKDQHETYCSECGAYRGLENHSWPADPSSTHICARGCGYTHDTYPNHMYDEFSGGIAEQSYSCLLTDGDGCGATVTLEPPASLVGLPIDQYAASDSTVSMGAVPDFVPGVYEFTYTGPLRDTQGNIVNDLMMPLSWVRLWGWTQRNLLTHASAGNYKAAGVSSMSKYLEKLSDRAQLITIERLNIMEDSQFQGWSGLDQTSGKTLIRNGNTYDPEVEYSPSKFTVKYYPGGGGWFFMNSPFFPNDDLFKVGSYQKEGAVPIYANVYYCYRVKGTGEVPWDKENGNLIQTYDDMYLHSSVVVYNHGHYTRTLTVEPDMNLIDNTGYRYVGHATSVSTIGGVSVASSPTSSSAQASVTVSSRYTSSAAIVTFFVEPVKLSHGHKATNYVGNVIDINFEDGSEYEGTDLEFRNYYNTSSKKCYIPVSTVFEEDIIEPLESIHKFYWPGYILESSRVYEAGTNLRNILNTKTYNEDTTTNLDGDPPRYVVNERVPSYYTNEADGYAVDKEFYYFYTTPTIEIEHKKYDNPDEYMKTTDEKDIKYVQQIVNEFAYIDSLITDNVKEEYTLKTSLAEGGTATFTYKYPNHDLVQIKIYEVTNSGYKHWATLYENERYNEGAKTYKIENYDGVFGDYYSESLDAIAEQLGKAGNELFTTNKNWKVEFIYDEVEKVHIKFKDIKGNNLFIQSGDKYIGELIYEIPSNGYSYTPQATLGKNERYRIVMSTKSNVNYDVEATTIEMKSGPSSISVEPNNGNWYIVVYYTSGKLLLVQYRDTEHNDIKDEVRIELPPEGAWVEVPQISPYKVKEYCIDTNYSGEGYTVVSGDRQYDILSGDSVIGPVPLTESDKQIGVTNSNETNQRMIIYYESFQGLKVEYRDMENNPIKVPPKYESEEYIEIPERGTKVIVPTVPGYKAREYQHNKDYNGTDTTISEPRNSIGEGENIPVPSNGKNQFIIIYYERIQGDSEVRVWFKEDIPTEPDIKDPIAMSIPSGEETSIYVPDIPEYTPVDYEIDGTKDIPIPPDKTIEVIGNPDNPIEIIIWYVKGTTPPPEPETPEQGTPDPEDVGTEDNKEIVILRANSVDSEEYEVIAAIPTSEDLYVSGDLFSYRFLSQIEQGPEEKTINIRIKQKYYTKLGSAGTSGQTSEIVVDIEDYDLIYNYYKIEKAELYDLTGLHLKNEAIKYYGNGGYTEGIADFEVNDGQPYIDFQKPVEEIKLVSNDDDTGTRFQLKSSMPGYNLSYDRTSNTIEIEITEIDYYGNEKLEADIIEARENQMKDEAIAVIEKCMKIKVPKLSICRGEDEIVILTGGRYDLIEQGTALDSTDYYIPHTVGRAPLYSFLYNQDLYVMESAKNQSYPTQMNGDYKLIEVIDPELQEVKTPTESTQLSVKPVIANGINVHTPIINLATLEANSGDVQLNSTIAEKLEKNKIKVINLEEKFTITIPNSGKHLNAKGYKNKAYNHEGLAAEDNGNDSSTGESRIIPKSNNDFMTAGIINNTGNGAVVDQSKIDSEQDSKGPSFAEYKLIRFPYDVYLTGSAQEGGEIKQEALKDGKTHLLKAYYWYNLYEFVKPGDTEYEFVIPTWVTDAKSYTGIDGIQVLIVAENATLEQIEKAMTFPMDVSEMENNTTKKDDRYILRTTFDTYVAGRLYDLQIRDSDDPGYMKKLKQALKGNTSSEPAEIIKEMPIGQADQVPKYNFGLKLGYRFYFDLKTKGISNKEVLIQPKIYYVSQDGATKTDDISLFYHSKTSMYNKLSESNLAVRMTMAGTHGIVNNPDYTQETILAKLITSNRVFTAQSIIGTLNSTLKLKQNTEKLPYTKLDSLLTAVGLADETALETSITEAELELEINDVKNATGHWYGEYYLPSSTIVVNGSGADKKAAMNPANVLKNGYLVVVFEEITTEDSVDENDGYLTYDAPTDDSQWSDEGIEDQFLLPNRKDITLGVEGAPMAIYQVGLRANNDFETEGTH